MSTFLPNLLRWISHFLSPTGVWAVHLWSVLCLLGASFGVLQLGQRLLGAKSSAPLPLAAFAALIFLCHPLALLTSTESVYLGWQLVTLISVWMVLAVLSFLSAPEISGILKMTCCLLLSGLCVPGGFLLTACAGVVAFCFSPDGAKTHSLQMLKATLGRKWVLTLVLAGMIGFNGLAIKTLWEGHGNQSSLEWTTHWLTQGRVFWLGLRAIVVPTNLLPSHVLPWSESAKDLVAVSGIALLAVASWWAWRNRGARHSQGRRVIAALFLLAMLPTLLRMFWLSAVPFSEARLYPALPWISLLLAFGLSWCFQNLRIMGIAVATGLPLMLGWLSFAQLQPCKDAGLRSEMVIEREPSNFQVRAHWQKVQSDRGNLVAVLQSSQPSVELYHSMVAFNAQNPAGRSHDLLSALRWWARGERHVLDAMAKNYGETYGQAFGNQSTARLRKEVEMLAQRQPEALPLLALLPDAPQPDQPTSRNSTNNVIPGISADVGTSRTLESLAR